MKDVVIVSGCRTAIGAFGGTLKDMNAANIAAVTMKEAILRAGIDPALIDDVRYGCCIEPADTLNTARVGALMAGIPVLYLMMMIPSFGNFGTREILWAELFHGYAGEASLYAFALWTNLIFLMMHVLIGVVFLKRAISLFMDLRRNRSEGGESIRQPILRDPLDP